MKPVNLRTETILEEVLKELKLRIGEVIYDLTVERVLIGVFFSGVKLSNGQGGICATPVKAMPEAVCCSSAIGRMPEVGKLKGRKAVELVEDILRQKDTALKKALAIAILNALSATYWADNVPEDYLIESDSDPMDLDLSKDIKVAVIGALGPLLKKLKQSNTPFWILEMDTSTLKADEMPFYVPPHRAAEVLPQADVVVSTGTTLINDTLEELLELARPEAEFIVVGPTASMLPGPFFRRGVTTVGGVLVTDVDQILEVIGEAGAGYHFFGKYADKISMCPRVV